VARLPSGILSRPAGKIAGLSIINGHNGTSRIIVRKHADRNSSAQQIIRERFLLAVKTLKCANEWIIEPYSRYRSRLRSAWNYAVSHTMFVPMPRGFFAGVEVITGTLPRFSNWYIQSDWPTTRYWFTWSTSPSTGFLPDDMVFFFWYIDTPPFARCTGPGHYFGDGSLSLGINGGGPLIPIDIMSIVVRPPGRRSDLISYRHVVPYMLHAGFMHSSGA
jgi:hypothetical protein